MKEEKGITLITVIIMIIVIAIIASLSIITTRDILRKAKENAEEENITAVRTAVQKYSARAIGSGYLSPANQTFPGIQNPSFTHRYYDSSGVLHVETEGVGMDWYLLLEDDLEEMTLERLELHKSVVEFIDQNYAAVIDNGLMDDVLVNEYKANVDKLSAQQPLSDSEQVTVLQWLDFMLMQMTDCAKDNLTSVNPQSVFKALLECVK